MSFADYQALVLRKYQEIRATGNLSHRMKRLTPAKLKAECEAVCLKRYDPKDANTLEEFFGPGEDKSAFHRAIRACDPDRFKPLVNFVMGRTRKPDEIIIELLAWLIDFKPRPHEFGRVYPTTGWDIPANEQDETLKTVDEKGKKAGESVGPPKGRVKENPAAIITGKRAKLSGKRVVIVTAIVLAVGIAGAYWAWPNTSADDKKGHHWCMYWVGDHYKEIPCNEHHGDTPVIAFDEERQNLFKKITRPDTITEDALGSIWYAKVNDVYECYTAPGSHPIDTTIQLRLLTDYVLIRHIRAKQGAEKPVQ